MSNTSEFFRYLGRVLIQTGIRENRAICRVGLTKLSAQPIEREFASAKLAVEYADKVYRYFVKNRKAYEKTKPVGDDIEPDYTDPDDFVEMMISLWEQDLYHEFMQETETEDESQLRRIAFEMSQSVEAMPVVEEAERLLGQPGQWQMRNGCVLVSGNNAFKLVLYHLAEKQHWLTIQCNEFSAQHIDLREVELDADQMDRLFHNLGERIKKDGNRIESSTDFYDLMFRFRENFRRSDTLESEANAATDESFLREVQARLTK